jgi:putative transposase
LIQSTKRCLQWIKNINEFSETLIEKDANVCVRYKKKYKATTNSDHNKPIYDNELKQGFDVQSAHQALMQDITHIWTSEGGLYFADVIDLYSRKVVGWSIGCKMKAQLV